MTTSTLTIHEFLLSRIAEDEADAETAASLRSNSPFAREYYGRLLIAPARVLAECEAKRQIVADYLLRDEQGHEKGGEVFGYHATGMKQAIRRLASVYADHPDYRQEWA